MKIRKSFAAAALLLAAPLCVAQQSIVYPAAGQSAQQQAQDQGECNAWAQQSTGVDPLAVAQQSSSTPPPSGPQGERARGAARGAIGGAAIGAIAGDTGQGAAIGAVVGTMAGGRRQRQQASQQQAAVQQQQAQAQQALATYQRAVTACMEGRHYVVK